MKRQRDGVVGVVLSAGLLLTALVTAETPPVADRGRVLFEQHCSVCHGKEGRGDGLQAPSLSPRPASFVSASLSVKTDQELLKIIADGKPHTSMRGWKDELSDEEQRAVLRHIRTLVRFHRSLTPPPPPSQP